MLFRKRWRNAATYKREATVRTIPTECYPDASDDGMLTKSQATILVRIHTIFLLSIRIFFLHIVLSIRIAGSSIRDESMYTTVTQKQSFDSMTVSQYQPVKLSNHNSMKSQSNDTSNLPPMASCADGATAAIADDDNVARVNQVVPFVKCTSSDADTYQPEFVHDKINEIRISISRTNKTKMRNPSRLSQMFGGLFKCRQSTRNIGYYSPPMEHPIDKISIRLNTCAIDSNDVAGHSVAASHHTKSRGHVAFATKPIAYSDDETERGESDSISNGSLKDCNATAIEDELSTYMKELKLRELR